MQTNKQSWLGFIVLSVCILAWYFFGFDIAQLDYNEIFANVGIHAKQYLILVIYVLWILVLTHDYSQNKDEFKYFYFSALATFFFTITLVLPTIFPYDRKDFVITIFVGTLSGYFLKDIRLEVEKLMLSFKIKSPILKTHIIILLSAAVYILILYAFLFFYSDIFLFYNTVLFLLTILIIFLFTIPKEVLFTDDRKKELKDLSDAISYRQELNSLGFDKKIVYTQGEALAEIQNHKNISNNYNSIKRRSKFLKDIHLIFSKNQDHAVDFKSETNDPEEIIVLIEFYDPKTGQNVKSFNVKFKYLLLAFEDMKNHMTDPKMLSEYLSLLTEKALEYTAVESEEPKKMLFSLIYNDNYALIKYFFTIHSINLNYIDDTTTYTPLLFSIVQSSKIVTELLLDKGSDPELSNKLGITPFNFAARYGKLEECKLLVFYGADINHSDVLYQYTPLMNAAMYGHIEIIEFLLSKGVDMQKIDYQGKKAINHAEEMGYGKIAALLRKATNQV